jgi:hypothetical protein
LNEQRAADAELTKRLGIGIKLLPPTNADAETAKRMLLMRDVKSKLLLAGRFNFDF